MKIALTHEPPGKSELLRCRGGGCGASTKRLAPAAHSQGQAVPISEDESVGAGSLRQAESTVTMPSKVHSRMLMSSLNVL